MWSVVIMKGKSYAMKSVKSFGNLHQNDLEADRLQTFVGEGSPVIFCEDLEDLDLMFPGSGGL